MTSESGRNAPIVRDRAALFILGGLWLAELLGIFTLTGGRLFFSQDDPYIHIALADQLSLGHFGLHPSVVSSPSSSPLWPLILACFATVSRWFGVLPTASLPWFILGLNAAATMVTALIVAEVSLLSVPELATRPLPRTVLVVALCLGSNVIGVGFTGMEHSLHLAVCAGVILGIVQLAVAKPPHRWLAPLLIVGPLLRYEGLAITAVGVVALWATARRGRALAVLAAVTLLLAGYSAFLTTLGLPALPMSALVKSSVVWADPHTWTAGLARNLTHPRGVLLCGFAVLLGATTLLGVTTLRSAASRPQRWVTAALIAAIAAHLSLARLGGFGRYELYLWLPVLLWSLWLSRSRVLAWTAVTPGKIVASAAVALAMLAPHYLYIQARTPEAARNLYLQHAQLRRLAVDHIRAPIAASDIGQLSLDNPWLVVDLVGLATPAVFQRRFQRPRATWIAEVTAAANAPAAFINPNWHGAPSPTWRLIGTLVLDVPRVAAASRRVKVYATRPNTVSQIRAAATEWAAQLPAGASFLPSFLPPSPARTH